MNLPGINSTSFYLILDANWFSKRDILNEELIVLENGTINGEYSHTEYKVQSLEDLEIEIRHFKFLLKNKLI